MKPRKIDHVGILVDKLEQALEFYQSKLGLPVKAIETSAEFQVRIAFLPIGEAMIELVEPMQHSPLRIVLEEKGEGLHHICLEVDDIKKSLADCADQGIQLQDAEPRLGGEGALVAFLEASGANNVSIELKEAGQ